MIVDQLAHTCRDEQCELSALVRSEAWDRESFTLWYRIPAELAPEHGEATDASPFLAGLLLWCCRRNETLTIEGPVSARLLATAPLAMDVCHSFFPELGAVEIHAETHERDTTEGVVASFFTRGVDSWYTALTHGQRSYDGPELTHLVYVPSVDFMFDEEHRARSVDATSSAARAIGKAPVIVETNLRHHMEHFLHWGITGGAGLASVALALGAARAHIPASRSFARQTPDCTHLFLDPLWSTERTQIIHHGAEADRWQKVKYLADHPDALKTLKVCFDDNTDGNCGRCPKCLVTMVMLEAAGVLDECPFDVPLDPARVARLDLEPPLTDLMRDDVVPALEDPQLAVAVRAMAARPTLRDVLQQGQVGLRALSESAARDPRGLTALFRRPDK